MLDRAVEAFDAEDYARAREFFEQAYALRPNARVLRGLGISAMHLERFSTSKRELTQALRETKQPLTVNQRDGVKELLSWMQDNLGSLRLQLRPANARVTLDDQPIAEEELVVKPGTHRVRVSADGFTTEDHSVQIEAGEEKTLRVRLLPASLEEPPETVAAADPPVAASGVAASAFVGNGSEAAPAALAPSPRDRDGSVLERWWFWTAVGVVVAGGVATAVALSAGGGEPAYERGGLGGVIMPLGRAP